MDGLAGLNDGAADAAVLALVDRRRIQLADNALHLRLANNVRRSIRFGQRLESVRRSWLHCGAGSIELGKVALVRLVDDGHGAVVELADFQQLALGGQVLCGVKFELACHCSTCR